MTIEAQKVSAGSYNIYKGKQACDVITIYHLTIDGIYFGVFAEETDAQKAEKEINPFLMLAEENRHNVFGRLMAETFKQYNSGYSATHFRFEDETVKADRKYIAQQFKAAKAITADANPRGSYLPALGKVMAETARKFKTTYSDQEYKEFESQYRND